MTEHNSRMPSNASCTTAAESATPMAGHNTSLALLGAWTLVEL
ncbi:hypothetical protein ACFYXC_35050 [Streptomyces sp. NPDC002701]